MILHPIEPVYNSESNILILGSFPSVKSREQGFFYGHPQNRFWRVMAEVFEDYLPVTIEEKRGFLIKNRVAVWDVIKSCDIVGSSDSSIKNVVPNDLSEILDNSRVSHIFLNGKKAESLFNKYIKEELTEHYGNVISSCLPSTSPANAAWTLDKLCDAWTASVRNIRA